MTLDVINGIFELGGACVNALNILQIRRDKQIQGVHWAPWVWFTVWGIFNLGYYPSLDQWVSFWGGCCIVITNLIWLGHVAYYFLKVDDPMEGHDTFEMKV